MQDVTTHPLSQPVIIGDLNSVVSQAVSSPTLFLVGSGISISAPACLPSARDMINLTLESLAPPDATAPEKDAICDALPELFYQGLFSLVGRAAVEPWTVLTLHSREPDAFPHRISPTAAHLLIVYLSWKHNLPIITTNFDTFFESAARLLGLQAVVSVPSGHEAYEYAEPNSTDIAIWKVHGSADNPDSICTTLQQISTLNPALIWELQRLFGAYPACLLGYSGRDIDLFPFVASFTFPQNGRAFWLCREFQGNHGIYARPEKFIGVLADAQDFARRAVPEITDHTQSARALREYLDRQQTSIADKAEQFRTENLGVYLGRGSNLVRQKLCPLLDGTGAPDRLLLHAVSLANVQSFSWAARHAHRYISAAGENANPRLLAKAWVLLSSCYHNLSKYEQSEQAAWRAYEISRAHGFTEEAIHAMASVDEAMRMQLYPNLPVTQRWTVPRVKYAVLLFRFFLDVLRIQRLIRHSGSEDNRFLRDSLRHVALEHRIRLCAMLQRAVRSLGGETLAARLLERQWEWIRQESYRAGYAAGIANALRYRDRVGRRPPARPARAELDLPGIVFSRQIYEFMSHRNGSALVLRDQADALVEQGASEEASSLYEQCVELARAAENASLELKGLLGLRRCGKQVDRDRIGLLLDNIEGDGYRRVRKAVMDFIAG